MARLSRSTGPDLDRFRTAGLAVLVGLTGCGGRTITQAPVEGETVPPVYRALDAGARHTCALDVDGIAYCWGSNADGALGVGPAVAVSRRPLV